MFSRSFYELFDSKADLVAEVAQQQWQWLSDTLKAVFEETEDPLERIDRGLRTYLVDKRHPAYPTCSACDRR